MSSELAVVTAEIVDILPREHQTLANKEWVETSLQGSPVSEVLAACKEYFNVANGKLAACEKRLNEQGIKLDRHIEYVDQKFKAYDSELSALKQDLAVTSALGNERAQMQQFLTGQLLTQQTAIQSSVANVAAKSSSSQGSAINPVTLAFGLAFGVILISCMASFAIKPQNTQTIEYKNVPNAGHPKQIPRELYNQL